MRDAIEIVELHLSAANTFVLHLPFCLNVFLTPFMHAQLWCIFEWMFVHQFCCQQSQAPVASSLQCLRQSSQGGGGGSVGLAQTLVLLRRIQRWLPVGTRSCVGSTEVRGSTGATQAWKWGCTNGFGLTARIVLSGTLHDLLLGLCYWLWSLVCCRGECEDKMFKVHSFNKYKTCPWIHTCFSYRTVSWLIVSRHRFYV